MPSALGREGESDYWYMRDPLSQGLEINILDV